MVRGLGIGLGMTRRRVDSFDPLSLGGWACLCDQQSIRATQADGTVPVTADSQAVRYWQDRSGNGLHLTTTGNPAVSLTLDSTPAVRFDATSGGDELQATWEPGDLTDFSIHLLAIRKTTYFCPGVQLRTSSTTNTTAFWPDLLNRMTFGSTVNQHLRPTPNSAPHLISIVRESGVIRFYFDGVLFHEAANAATVTPQVILLGRDVINGPAAWDALMVGVSTQPHSQLAIDALVSHYRRKIAAYSRPDVGAVWLSNSLGSGYYNTPTTGSVPYLASTFSESLDDTINYSMAGKRTTQFISEFTGLPTSLIAIPDQPVVIVWEGSNDLKAGVTGAQAATNLFTLCTSISTAFPNAKIVLVTVIDRGDVDYAEITACNNSLKANWATYADALADLTTEANVSADGASANTTYFIGDEIHTNGTGDGLIAPIIGAAIESAIAS